MSNRMEDLVKFAGLMKTTGDLEPWAEMIKAMTADLDREQTLWLISLYNTYDSINHAWAFYLRWPTPQAWCEDPDRAECKIQTMYAVASERRNLYGGRVMRRLTSYCQEIERYGWSQEQWLLAGWANAAGPEHAFELLTEHVRTVWGVGRQAGFEWAEFLMKVADYPLLCGDAQLWESTGPRKSLELIYDMPRSESTPKWLGEAAWRTREHLGSKGVVLPWEDFETVICDFKVMMGGRYYLGKHLALLRGEIAVSAQPSLLQAAWDRAIPPPWNEIAPGIDYSKNSIYKNTGIIQEQP